MIVLGLYPAPPSTSFRCFAVKQGHVSKRWTRPRKDRNRASEVAVKGGHCIQARAVHNSLLLPTNNYRLPTIDYRLIPYSEIRGLSIPAYRMYNVE